MVSIVRFTQFFFQLTCIQRDKYNAIYRMKNRPVVFKNERDKTTFYTYKFLKMFQIERPYLTIGRHRGH